MVAFTSASEIGSTTPPDHELLGCVHGLLPAPKAGVTLYCFALSGVDVPSVSHMVD
jgi:hypothetical protein